MTIGYSFQGLKEAAWAAMIAAAAIIGQMLIELDADIIDNWETWAITGITAAARAAVAAAVAVLFGPD